MPRANADPASDARSSGRGIAIETRLILCFTSIFVLALGVTCYIFARETQARVSEIMGEQARQLTTALSRTSEQAIRDADWGELRRMGNDLIRTRNILYVGYLDSNARAKVLASRDLDFGLANLSANPQSATRVRRAYSPTFGNYVEAVMPILSSPSSDEMSRGEVTRLLGYVVVGVSQANEEAMLTRTRSIVIAVAGITAAIALPLAFLLVHRIFLPIRQLLMVTRRITAGDLDARVEVNRADIIGQLACSFDEMVSWVKQQRQQLADANRDLERKIEQRTAQLEMANARLSAEIAEKEEFLRTVSHDLNAPLRNISGMAMMLLAKNREQFDEEVIHRLERIKSNVDIETDLIGQLLELSRIKTRRMSMETVNVGQIIDELRNMFENDLRGRGIELVVESPLPPLNAERPRIRQIFQNLIDNAIKYMGDSPSPKIAVGCEVHGTEAEFWVRDTGIGIEPEDLGKVFYVFRRGKNSHARQIAGKGVGLASVKSIVETYNGTIWVTSVPGRGSTFRFTINGKFVLPAAPIDAPGGEPVAA